MASKPKQKSKQKTLTTEGTVDIKQNYSQFQSELKALAQKIGELESEAEEHDLVLITLDEQMKKDPKRKCFRMIGGVLVERTVEEVVPNLQTNLEGIKKVVATLVGQYKSKEEEFANFVKEYNIRVKQ